MKKIQSRRTGWNKLLLGNKNTIIERNKRQMSGGSLMIYLTVSHFGPIILSEVQGRMDSQEYINLLSQNVFPVLDQHATRSSWQWQ